MKTQTSNARRLTESALMIALAVLLGFVKLVDLPYGGSITMASMVPVILVAYRHGTPWGLLTGLVYSLIEFVLGSGVLSYATSAAAAVAIVLLDYILAFTAVGLGSIFRGKLNNSAAVGAGTLVVCLVRYLMHVISGCTVWAGLSIPTGDALIYSVIYNATYMLPETIVAILAAVYVSSLIDFTKVNLAPAAKEDNSRVSRLLTAVSSLAIIVGLIVIVALVFSRLQNPETGSFDITGIHNVNGTALIVTVVVTALVSATTFFTGKVIGKKA
ncbi:MAG: energy-coupled thiamine transporter ThiT [Lachnospiraceae bacterium]|nr:energy-coupled thiamine transporter ThiT [Lachnospiraceae bacterium]